MSLKADYSDDPQQAKENKMKRTDGKTETNKAITDFKEDIK